MKKLIPLFFLLFTSCANWPKDAYIKDAEVVTPWGHTKAAAIATGKAATNLTQAERQAILTPSK